MGYDLTRFKSPVNPGLICFICKHVPEDPIEVICCQNMFCLKCINDWLQTKNSCPVDGQLLDVSLLLVVPKVVINIIKGLDICCDFATVGCQAVVKLGDIKDHEKSCPFNRREEDMKEKKCKECESLISDINKFREEVKEVKDENKLITEILKKQVNAFDEMRTEMVRMKEELKQQKNFLRQVVREESDLLRRELDEYKKQEFERQENDRKEWKEMNRRPDERKKDREKERERDRDRDRDRGRGADFEPQQRNRNQQGINTQQHNIDFSQLRSIASNTSDVKLGGGFKMGSKKAVDEAEVQTLITREVKLHTTDKAWKPAIPSLSKADADLTANETEVQTLDLNKRFRGILNKLTPQKFEALLLRIQELKIDTEDRLKRILDLVYDKAVDEPSFCVLYAKLCRHLSLLKVTTVDEEGKEDEVMFTRLLLCRCQREFESDVYADIDIEGKEKAIKECAEDDKRKLLVAELDEEKRKARRKSLGNIKLIGELYGLNMLKGNIMFSCIQMLLNDGEEESLECLCTLLQTIGGKLEGECKDYEQKQAKKLLDAIFDRLNSIVGEMKTSARVRFLLQNVLDMWENHWNERTIQKRS